MSLQQRPSDFVLRLPRHSLYIVAGAFGAGLLLFLLVWWSSRGDNEFYTVEAGTPAASPIADLPAPLVEEGNFSGMEAPDPDAANQAILIEDPNASALPPAEPVPATPDAAATAALAQQAAQAATQAPSLPQLALPVPIPGQSPPPEYPEKAMRKGETGRVLLRVKVDASGRPRDVDIAQRSGTRSLDRAAVAAVKKWRFTPAAAENGQPVEASVDIPIDFTLQR